tara:strand:+ start:31 stop:447 length:417 start_codon:yes stop_codon:yes gene_type:complete
LNWSFALGIILILGFIGLLAMTYIFISVKIDEKKHPYDALEKKIKEIENNKLTDKVLDYHVSGELSYEANFIDGVQQGKCQHLYHTGQISTEGYYKDGYRDGEWTEWQRNGNLKAKRIYKDGLEVDSTIWDDSDDSLL